MMNHPVCIYDVYKDLLEQQSKAIHVFLCFSGHAPRKWNRNTNALLALLEYIQRNKGALTSIDDISCFMCWFGTIDAEVLCFPRRTAVRTTPLCPL